MTHLFQSIIRIVPIVANGILELTYSYFLFFLFFDVLFFIVGVEPGCRRRIFKFLFGIYPMNSTAR